MGRAFLGLAVLASAWLACVTVARGQDAFSAEWGRGLDLTVAQQARGRLILSEARADADDVDADAALSATEKQARFAAIERRVDERLYRMLTPPQQDRFRMLHPEVVMRMEAAPASTAEPQVDGGIGTGPPEPQRRPASRDEQPAARDDKPTVADQPTLPAPPQASRPAIVLPLPTFNVFVKMGGIPIPIPVSLPPVQIRL